MKYFRRLLSTHAPQIFGNGRNVDSAGSYPLLAAEVQKVTQDPIRAVLIAEAVDQGDGEGFRDFDLSTFLEHFKMNSFAKVTLASAFKRSSKADLRTKGELSFMIGRLDILTCTDSRRHHLQQPKQFPLYHR